MSSASLFPLVSLVLSTIYLSKKYADNLDEDEEKVRHKR